MSARIAALETEVLSLKERENSYRSLFEAASDRIFIQGPEDEGLNISAPAMSDGDIALRDRETVDKDGREGLEPRENHCLKSIHRGVIGLMGEASLDGILETIISGASAMAGAPDGFVYLMDPGQQVLVMRAGSGLYENMQGFRLGPGEGLSGRILQDGKPLVVDDYSSWPGRSSDHRFDALRSIVGVPLKSGTMTIGVIGFGHTEERRKFGRKEMEFLGRFAKLASLALENAYMYLDLQRELAERARTEQALRRSEEKFRTLFEKTGDAILLFDSGRVVDCNQAAVSMMGCLRKDQLLGLYSAQLSPENQPDGYGSFEKAAAMRDTAFREGSFRFEWMLRKMTGLEFPAEVLLTSIPLGDRWILHAVFRDISNRKWAEEALRESEERFRKFAEEATFEGIIIHDGEKILDVNRQFAKMYGYRRRDLARMALYDTIAPECRNLVRGHVREGYEKTYGAVALRSDGSTFPVEINEKTIPFHGRMLRAAAVRDISEQKRAEESLREEKEKFRVLVEESPLGVALLGKNEENKYVNPRFTEMFGYSPDELTHTEEWFKRAFPDPEYRKQVVSAWVRDKEIFNTVEMRPRVFTVTCKDGSKKVINFRSVNMESGDKIVILEDITERIRLQDQLHQAQKLEAIGTLAGGIAHDFNNILGAIIGYTELGRDSLPADSEVRRDLEQVLNAGSRAKELVKQILTFSRQRETQVKPLRVSLILKEALKLLRASLPSSIEIHRVIEDEAITILADPSQVHQVLMNLCANAAHAMRERGGLLEVSMGSRTIDRETSLRYQGLDPGSYLSIRVRDTGHGMSPETMQRIFDPYFTTKAPGEGTGLGLAVAHGIVKGCGGAISVESVPGEGTTFEILIPRAEREGTGEGADSLETPPTGKERILFVDDEEIIADIVGKQLAGLGYDVTLRTNSREALSLVRAQPGRFDLVVTDQTMPGMTGSELALEIMAIRRDIPIILCTGFSEMITEEKAREMGIREFVRKPLTKGEMAKIVRKVLDNENG